MRKLNKEIMLALGIKKRTFYRYESIIITYDTVKRDDVKVEPG
jgi:DNA-binding CsgD family transcriptional regulator